jgi:large subunit ribosomal protein L4
MSSINVVGKNPSTLELALPEAKTHVLYEVVNWQLAKRRRGTASTQTRAEVSRTGKKLYSQKGTGNARHGDRAAPIYVGGGAAFGPKPRDYSYTLPKKVRKLGLAMAVSSRLSEGKVVAVDGFEVDGKTKSFVAWAKKHGMDGSERVFLVTSDEMTIRAAKNLPWVTAVKAAGLNTYDILRHQVLVADKGVLEALHNDKTDHAATPKAAKSAAPKAAPTAAPAAEVQALKAAPVAETAPAPKAKKAAAGDDLKRVEGIGPKINDALIAAGITTFAQLEAASEESLKAALETAGLRFAPSLGTWAEQAGYLARGDEAGFAALTEKLVAGRKEEGEA